MCKCKWHRRTYRWSGFFMANEGRSIPPPPALPMPSLFKTSRTSPGPASLFLCWGRDRTGVNFRDSPCVADVCSKVDIEPAVSRRFGFDILLRPSSASRRSVTPTPRVERARLARERFSMCMNAGETLTRGESASPPRKSTLGEGASTAVAGQQNIAQETWPGYSPSLKADSADHEALNLRRRPWRSKPVAS